MKTDPGQVQAVAEWSTPKMVQQLFLGYSNFYLCFITDYSRVAAPLTKLTSPATLFSWRAKLVGRIQAPIYGRLLLGLALLGKAFPHFSGLYTCSTCTPAIQLRSTSLPCLNPVSSLTHRRIVFSTTVDHQPRTSLPSTQCLICLPASNVACLSSIVPCPPPLYSLLL